MSARKQPLNGKQLSRNYKPALKNSRSPQAKLQRKLEAVYNLYQRKTPAKANARSKQTFVFNMSDWSDDLQVLAELYNNPESFDDEIAGQIVAGFLIHVIPHLTAAGRLLLDYTPGDQFRELEKP